jgi:hypothetical protein
MLDLILKDIDDIYSRENFKRLSDFVKSQVFFDGNFELFDVTVNKASDKFEIPHGLTFIPTDIIQLATEGNFNYFFRYQEFTKTSIFVTSDGPVRLRFLAGRLTNPAGTSASTGLELVPPTGITSDDVITDIHLDLVVIDAASTYITEATRDVRTITTDDTDEVTTILGTYRVQTDGVTTLTTGSSIRVAS